MTTPTAEPLDARDPWPEVRPPHLPDRLTAVAWLAWPFVALAVTLLVVAWPRVQDLFRPGAFAIVSLIGEAQPAVVALLGAALFWRHPDALRTMPYVVVGAALLAAREVLRALVPILEGTFATLTPAAEAFSFFVPLSTAYNAFATLIGLFGLVYLARGLGKARRFENAGSSHPTTAAVVVLALLLGFAQWSPIGTLPPDTSMTIGTLVVVSLGLTILNLVAWGYLTLTAWRGQLAGEAPSRGWLAVTLAGLCVFGSAIILAVLNWVVTEASDGALLAAEVAGLMRVGASVLLLVALAIGLPSTAEGEWLDAEEAASDGGEAGADDSLSEADDRAPTA